MSSTFGLKRFAGCCLWSSLRLLPPAMPFVSSRLLCTTPRRRFDEFPPLNDVFYPSISEMDVGVVIRLALPGFAKEDVKVKLSVEDNALLIDGNCPVSQKICKRIQIPKDISYSSDNIKADIKNGLLKVYLPKKEEKKKTLVRIEVEDRI